MKCSFNMVKVKRGWVAEKGTEIVPQHHLVDKLCFFFSFLQQFGTDEIVRQVHKTHIQTTTRVLFYETYRLGNEPGFISYPGLI